jgi:hypothetical protein
VTQEGWQDLNVDLNNIPWPFILSLDLSLGYERGKCPMARDAALWDWIYGRFDKRGALGGSEYL